MGSKKGRYYETGTFGDDAEDYVSRLFWMMKNPNGNRRPDLISINGRYTPRLSVEVKSGVMGKVSIVSTQLHYGITTARDYEELFGERFTLDSVSSGERLPGIHGTLTDGIFFPQPVAYYYDIISRDKGVSSEDVAPKFSSIKLEWKNQVLVPHDLVFHYFAISRSMRTGERFEDVKEDLIEQMKSDLREQRTHYKSRRTTQNWQDFNLRDMVALHEGNLGIASKGKNGGQERLRRLEEVYPGYDSLQRVEIPGPNGTRILILANPEDVDLFDRQLRATVEERIPHLERVYRGRKRAVGRLLKKIRPVYAEGVLIDGVKFPIRYSCENLTRREIQLLTRLGKWADRGEPLELKQPYNPRFDGCSDEVEEGNEGFNGSYQDSSESSDDALVVVGDEIPI